MTGPSPVARRGAAHGRRPQPCAGRRSGRCRPRRSRGHGPVEQRSELDALVAAQARVRGAAGGVLRDEVVDDLHREARAEVPHVEGDADPVGDAAGVHRVLDRAAAAGTRAERAGVAVQRQVDAGDVVPGIDRARGGDRGVDPSAHRGQHLHADQAKRPAGPRGGPEALRGCEAPGLRRSSGGAALDLRGGRALPGGERQLAETGREVVALPGQEGAVAVDRDQRRRAAGPDRDRAPGRARHQVARTLPATA